MRNEPSAAPALTAATGILILAAMDAVFKAATVHFSVLQILFLRFAFGSVFAFIAFAYSRRRWPGMQALGANLLRAIAGVLSGLTFLYAIANLPLAQAMALSYSTALFLVLFGWLFLREEVSRAILGALAIGLAGIVIVLPGELFSVSPDTRTLGVLSAVVSAATYALAMMLVRQRTAHDPIETIVLLQNVFCTMLLLPFVLFAWRNPGSGAIGMFALTGICGVAGHLFITWGYARANASRLAPLEYTGLLWASAFSVLFFNEPLTTRTVVGGSLIVLSGMMIAKARTHRTTEIEARSTAE